MATIAFYGAAQQVTGSCYLLESSAIGRVLLECGMHQGRDAVERFQEETFEFNPADIDAGSGMCTGGRIRHHLKHRMGHDSNTIIFIGFQAQGTLGRLLVDGVRRIKMYGKNSPYGQTLRLWVVSLPTRVNPN